MTLDTQHLRLQPFSAESLLALVAGERQFAEQFGLPLAAGLRGMFASDDVSPDWLEQLRASQGVDPWLHGFAVVHRDEGLIIGSAGFKGPPDEEGAVEIAYGIAPAYEGRGYATEAAAALVGFAFADARVRLVRAHTLPTANASTRVLTKCGFAHVGEVIDPEDGRVWRWEKASP